MQSGSASSSDDAETRSYEEGDELSEDLGSQDTSDDDESDNDSLGSLEDFVSDEIVPVAPDEPDVSDVSTANILVGKRTRRPAAAPYRDPEYARLFLEDVPVEEIAVALGTAKEDCNSSDGSQSSDASEEDDESEEEASTESEDESVCSDDESEEATTDEEEDDEDEDM